VFVKAYIQHTLVKFPKLNSLKATAFMVELNGLEIVIVAALLNLS
jgi:hypothetical protein